MRHSLILVALLVPLSVACGGKKDAPSKAAPGSGSAKVGSAAGSAAAGSGSAAAGSGSAAAGSGSAAGSADGSGSAAGSGSADGSGSAAGSGSADGSGSAAGSGSADGSGSAAAVKFDDMDHEAQVAFMKQKVQPAMKAAFQGFDAAEFGKFNCKSCHGKDADARKFEMPNPGLPKLNFADLEKTTDEDEQKMLEFMNKVKHEMAELLGEPEMNKDTPTGFGCLSCHLEEK